MNNKKTMLVVDDIELNREILASSFCDEYNILYANNGIEAIEVITQAKNSISIILLDIIMPKMNGIEFLKWLSAGEYSHLPVIAITSDESYQVEALKQGAWDFIPKPIDYNVIEARINNVISRYALGDAKKENEMLAKAKLEIDNLVNSIPGGIATYRVTNKGFETTYFSDGVAALSGHTREEYKERISGDATSIIYDDDRHRLVDSAIATLKSGESIDETYRIYHKNGSLVWVRITGVIIGEEDGYPIMHAVFQSPPRMAQLYDNIVNESQNLIYVSDVNNYELLYVNKTGLNVIHKTNIEYSGKKCYEFLFGRTSPCKFCKINEMTPDKYIIRDFSYENNNCIYSIRGKLIDWNGIPAHVEYIQDVTEQRKAEQKNLEWISQLQLLMDNIPGGLCVYKMNASGINPMIHNKAFFDIFGYSIENQKKVLEKTNFLNVHPDDLSRLKEIVSRSANNNESINHTYRTFSDEKNKYIWINMNAVIVSQENGEKFCYVCYTDVTREREAHNELVKAQSILEDLRKQTQDALDNYKVLVNTVPGGIVKYEVKDKKILTVYFSDGICELTGNTREERESIGKENILSFTYPEDDELLKSAIQKAVPNHENINLIYRIVTKNGSPKWVHLIAAYSRGSNGECYYHAVFTDVDKLKQIEKELIDNQLRYDTAVKSSGLNMWEYSILDDKLLVVSNSSRIKQNCFFVENYIESTLKNGYVREDSIEKFLSIFERLKNGEKEITEDLWYKTNNENGWWCERVIYTNSFDDSGRAIKAFGAGRDVTREKEAEKRFLEEMSYRKAIQSDNLSSIMLDLTNDSVLETESVFNSVLKLNGGTVDNYFKETSKQVVGSKILDDFKKRFNRKALISSFESGEFVVQMNLTRLYDNDKIYWVSYSVHLVQKVESNNIIAHISCVDITQEKVMQSIMESVAKTDYDSFVVVDGSHDSARNYAVSNDYKLYDENKSFEQQNEALIRQSVCKEDVERVIKECKIKNAWKKIENGEPYKFTFSMKTPDGQIRRKQLQFTAIDSTRKTYLISRIDVNSIYEEQEQAKNNLRKALSAKSEFLSNMSHDMRTPMNGILGLLALTMDLPNLSDEVLQNLNGIHSSGEYLLRLINDTLDMSKIENGKMSLNYDTVNSAELIKNISGYVSNLATDNGVALNIKSDNAELSYIKTDPLRLQQVFVNIVSNAIKFTPNGGKVDVIIECYKRENGVAYDKITVKDNGIGMSKEFLPKIFEPFEQENAIITKTSGTGLGMPIVKKLVEMMGGTIEIKSEKNVGTEVIVWLTFERVYPNQIKDIKPSKSVENLKCLESKRILIVEDHPLNATIAMKLLEKKGIIAELAENGKIAVDKFNDSKINYFDAVLMDIRMPVMNGLESAKAIRKLDRADALTVPIIAMTANAFDEDIRHSIDAGMNAHLAKPIEPQKLYNTLASFLSEKQN